MADHQNRFFHRKKIMTIFFVCAAVLCGLLGRLLYLMVWRAEYYEEAATRLHERERSIKAARGRILDRNGVVLADNKMVCTVSVIHNQIEEPEQVIAILVKELGISEEEARKRVEKYSSIERVKSNVDSPRALPRGNADTAVTSAELLENCLHRFLLFSRDSCCFAKHHPSRRQ